MVEPTSRRARGLGAGTTGHAGLNHLLRLQGLQSLDLWGTRLSVDDLRLVKDWPLLNYLSIGQPFGIPALDPDAITELLLACPSLKRAWVDGVDLQTEHLSALNARLDLRFDPPDRFH